MRRPRLYLLFGLVAVLAAGSGLVPPLAAADPDPAKLHAVRERMERFIDKGELAGLVTVIGTRQGVVSLEAIGKRTLEDGDPMPKDALFRIASMTKPVTAVAVMMLADEGRLSIEDPVEKILPEFRGQMVVDRRDGDTLILRKPKRPITVRDLLTHTSGLPNFPPGLADLYQKRNLTLAEATLAMSQRPLDFEPGSRWAYCNPGIDTLGRIVEVVSGLPYEEFLRKRIFQPLGMKDTTFYPNADQRRRVAGLYDRKDGKLVPAPRPIIGPADGDRHPIPAGGLFSTGEDLAKLYRMMLNGGTQGNVRLLSEKAVREMTRVQTDDKSAAFTPGMGFGLGWVVVREPQGVTAMLSPGAYGHGGAFGTQGWLDPNKDLFVILLIQRVGLPNADASDMRRELQTVAIEALGK